MSMGRLLSESTFAMKLHSAAHRRQSPLFVPRAQHPDGWLFLVSGEGLGSPSANIRGGDKSGAENSLIGSGVLHCHKATHTVSNEDNAGGVQAQDPGHGGRAQIIDRGCCVLDAVGESEISERTPGAPVVKVKNIPSCATNILGQIEVALVTGESVEQYDYRMWPCTRGNVDEGVEQSAVAGDLKALHGSRIGSLLGSERRRETQSEQDGKGKSLWKARKRRIHRAGLVWTLAQCFLPMDSKVCNYRVLSYWIQNGSRSYVWVHGSANGSFPRS
jgi:hypothetical protein